LVLGVGVFYLFLRLRDKQFQLVGERNQALERAKTADALAAQVVVHRGFSMTAQYLAGMTADQDPWGELAKAIVSFLGADLVVFGERGGRGGICLHHWTPGEKECFAGPALEAVEEEVAEVLESGFLAIRTISDAKPRALLFLPMAHKNQTSAVVVVGHDRPLPFPEELINAYLSVSGLAGTMFARLMAERALAEAHEQLENRVGERTAALVETNQRLQDEIAERGRMEKALRESEESYRVLAENATDLIAKYTPEGIFLYASPSCHALLGYEPGEIIGHSLFEYAHPEDVGPLRTHFSAAPSGRGVDTLSYRMRRNDGSYTWFETTGKVLCASDAGGEREFLGVSRDVTHRKKMEEELVKARKLEATGILAGGIAHDFNNLLMVILGNIEMAREDAAPGSSAFGCLRDAEKAVLRANDLTKKFLTFSTGGAPRKGPASIREVIESCIALNVNNSNVECRCSFPDDLWLTDIDRNQVSQVFFNVVVNAKEAMPGGGFIDIRAENVSVGPGGGGTLLEEGRYVRIAVRDHGIGIPRENLGKVFDPYYSTKERGSQKGMGMGLTVAYSIVRKHAGNITVESDTGTGATFSIYLPALAVPGGAPGAGRPA
jgi:PAS domain S-box-containing protein